MATSLDVDVALSAGWHSTGRYDPGSKYFNLISPDGEEFHIKSPLRKPISDAIDYDKIIPKYSEDIPAIWKLLKEYIRDNPSVEVKNLGDLSSWLKTSPNEVCIELCKLYIKLKRNINSHP